MHHRDIYRAVARATGETISEISRRGFSLESDQQTTEDELPSNPLDRYLDWDSAEGITHNTAIVEQPPSSLIGFA